MQCSRFLSHLALILGFVLSFPTICSAQWVTESYPLKPGWNAIWLSHDPSRTNDPDRTRGVEKVLENYSQIVEVWRWNPLGSTVQFTQSPNEFIQSDTDWAVWRRGDNANSTLGTMTGNAAYLVSVAPGTAPFTLQLTGRPLVPSYKFSSSGLNFLGFPTTGESEFANYFSNDPVLADEPQIFRYVGGTLSDVAPKNPAELLTPNTSKIARGQAYWVRADRFTGYYGPLKVTVLGSGGIDFGRKLNTVRVRVKNATDPLKNKTVTASFDLVASVPPPGGGTVPPPVPVRVRGPLDANLQYTYTDLPTDFILAPGEEKELTLDANRSLLTVADQAYESILRVTDSLGHTRQDLPVNAIGSSPDGVWIGAAVLDSVNQVETISGPEFDASVDAVDGSGPVIESTATVTTTTSAGATTRTTRYAVEFDAAGYANLNTTDEGGATISLTSVSDPDPTTPDFQEDRDYTLGPSDFAAITDPGSGYTEAPIVELSGGTFAGGADAENIPAEAEATLDAVVRRVKITQGGVDFRNQPLDLVFSGGGGSGVAGYVTLDENGEVSGVTLTEGGSDYTSAPTVEFPPAMSAGGVAATGTAVIVIAASATATLESDAVASVSIADGGSGYSIPPVVIFTGGGGQDAEAEAEIDPISGEITSVTILSGGSGYTTAPQVEFFTGAPVTGVIIDTPGSGYVPPIEVGFDGGGGGATGFAVVSDSGIITDIFLTDGGSGYQSQPMVKVSGGGGTGFVAEAEIAGGVGSVEVTVTGSDYTLPPSVSFQSKDGEGSGAAAVVSLRTDGTVGGVDRLRKVDIVNGPIGERALVSRTTSAPAAPGTPEGTSTSTVFSRSQLVTLGRKSHLVTRRISSGGAAAAPSNFPIRLILHSPPSGAAPTLLQQVFLGQRDGTAYAGPEEAALASLVTAPLVREGVAIPPGELVRLSSASFPRGESWAGSGSFGSSVDFSVQLGHDAATNPFVHTYHPDHDNWDARFERPLPAGQESYTVKREITLAFSATPPPGVSNLGWGVTTVGGTYTEIFTGLRVGEISVSGPFVLHQVSEVQTLTNR